jgi:hypothetical protein
MIRKLLIVGILGVWQQFVAAQTIGPADDAAKIYLRAAKLINDSYAAQIMAPSASNLNYREYPPYPPEWINMEKVDFAANAQARALAHQARTIEQASWPKRGQQGANVSYLNNCRALSNELADAALYQSTGHDDAAAVETLLDQWHLVELLENQPDKTLVRFLVSIGIRAQCCVRLEIVTSGAKLTNNPDDGKDLQTKVARQLIAELLAREDAKTEVNVVLHEEGGAANNIIIKPVLDRIIETDSRVNTERDLAAMSMACHLYRFDKGSWPTSPDELKDYLPGLPIDPWGNGKQTLGYVLIEKGLPDGSDRPLVYSRCGMKDGLFFRVDEPKYSYYTGDGSKRPAALQKQGGQFRDVADWMPAKDHPSATTQPLPDVGSSGDQSAL